jgi:hypothetical protein
VRVKRKDYSGSEKDLSKDLSVVDGDEKMTMVVMRAGNARADPTFFRLLAIRSVNTTPGPCVRTLWQHHVKSAPRTF